MTTTTDKLAEAAAFAADVLTEAGAPTRPQRDEIVSRIRAALAEYEAGKAAPAPVAAGEHTPEPWFTGAGDGDYTTIRDDANGAEVAAIEWDWDGEPDGRANANANARRIVACVNACAGIPTEALAHAQTVRITGEKPDGDCFTYERGQPTDPATWPKHNPHASVPIPARGNE